MPYYFSNENLATGKKIIITGEEAWHVLHSQRCKVGDIIKLQGPDGCRYKTKILSTKKTFFEAVVMEQIRVPDEIENNISLFQALVSEKAIDYILEKATELGVKKLVLFNAKNTATFVSISKYESKKVRWEKILKQAAKQSERAQWPKLTYYKNLEEALGEAVALDDLFVADIGGQSLKMLEIKKAQKIGVLIGPEGGLEESELEHLKKIPSAKFFSLGPALLKSDTAALASVSVLRSI